MNLEYKQHAMLRALHSYISRMSDDARAFRIPRPDFLGATSMVPTPSLDKSSVVTVNGLDYVRVVDSAGSLCAVYRITAHQLKRLKRWPAELNSPTPTAH